MCCKCADTKSVTEKTTEGLAAGKGKKDSRSPVTIGIACVIEMVKGVAFLPCG
jgi:hypothetical protein